MTIKIEDRHYTSVAEFSADIANVIQSTAGLGLAPDVTEAHNHLSSFSLKEIQTTAEQKAVMIVGKRIIGRLQPLLREAQRKEAELHQKSFERELEVLESIFRGATAARVPKHEAGAVSQDPVEDTQNIRKTRAAHGDVALADDILNGTGPSMEITPPASQKGDKVVEEQTVDSTTTRGLTTPNDSNMSLTGQDQSQDPLAQGGIPWYMEHFEPSGTCVHEERYSGREVLREMSEELTDLDDEGMNELSIGMDMSDTMLTAPQKKMAPAMKKKRRARAL